MVSGTGTESEEEEADTEEEDDDKRRGSRNNRRQRKAASDAALAAGRRDSREEAEPRPLPINPREPRLNPPSPVPSPKEDRPPPSSPVSGVRPRPAAVGLVRENNEFKPSEERGDVVAPASLKLSKTKASKRTATKQCHRQRATARGTKDIMSLDVIHSH